ncbi:MAG TPA: hypothetical protein PLE74_01910 [Candidatus Cloacimonadota bacterium]|nr:hypothetical protein [Candidatus Cloacimonadota bacterium]HPT71021.1 hypothetical protein [Candidatus Cloacimonadota bacterium]
MKSNYLILIVIFLISTVTLSAVFDNYEPSARARAMGGAYAAVSDDAGGVFYNPAGIALGKNNVQIGFSNLYDMEFSQLKTAAGIYTLPQKLGTIGIGVQNLDVTFEDTNLMSEGTYTFAHSFDLLNDIHSRIMLGYTANLYHLKMLDFGSEDAFGFGIGGMAILHQRTRIGFFATNLNSPDMGKEDNEKLPKRMDVGISYQPYEGVVTSVDLKQDFSKATEIHGGVEVQLIPALSLRFGVHNNPGEYSAGLGFNLKYIQLDYTYKMHDVLSDTHQFSVGYQF